MTCWNETKNVCYITGGEEYQHYSANVQHEKYKQPSTNTLS